MARKKETRDRDQSPVLRSIVTKLDSYPLNGGGYQLMLRLRQLDKAIVDLAAKSMHLSQADFCRVLVVNGAREVLSQLGIPEPVVSTAYDRTAIVSGATDSD